MNSDIDDVTWYKMYELCKELEGEKENIETSMIWGSLWDETMEWLIESEAEISTGEKMTYELIAKDSTKWGNYYNAEFEYRTTSGGTAIKSENSEGYLPTGCSEYTKVNNIYDLAGNRRDWTLEAYSTGYRVYRGGLYSGNFGSYKPAGNRNYDDPTYYKSVIRLSLRTLHKVICVS